MKCDLYIESPIEFFYRVLADGPLQNWSPFIPAKMASFLTGANTLLGSFD